MSAHGSKPNLELSDGERAIARHFKQHYGLKWPFAAHLAKDAIMVMELEHIRVNSALPDHVKAGAGGIK